MLLGAVDAFVVPTIPASRPRASTVSHISSPTVVMVEQQPALATLTGTPVRAAMAATWVGFSVYVAAFSPGSFAADGDTALIQAAINDPTTMNPIFFAVFNALGLIPAVNAALLLPGARDQTPLPAAPFLAGGFFLGYGAM